MKHTVKKMKHKGRYILMGHISMCFGTYIYGNDEEGTPYVGYNGMVLYDQTVTVHHILNPNKIVTGSTGSRCTCISTPMLEVNKRNG